MILFSISVNRILYGNRHAAEIIISAYFQIPPQKDGEGFCDPCLLRVSYFVLAYLLPHILLFG